MDALEDLIVTFGWVTDPEILGAAVCGVSIIIAVVLLMNGYHIGRKAIRAGAWGSERPWWRSPRIIIGPVLHSTIAIAIVLLGGYRYARESMGGAPHPWSLGVGAYVVHAVVMGHALGGDPMPCYVLAARQASSTSTAAHGPSDDLRFYAIPTSYLCAILERIGDLPAAVSIRTSSTPGEVDVSVRGMMYPQVRPAGGTTIEL